MNESARKMMESHIEDISPPQEGSLIEGEVVGYTENEVLLNIGYKYEGAILKSEFKKDIPSRGEPVKAIVSLVNEKSGVVVLSYKKARAIQAIDNIKKALEEGKRIKGRITKKVKGGYLVDIGLTAFLPGSLSGIPRGTENDRIVNREVEVKVKSMDQKKKDIILDRVSVLEEDRKKRARTFLSSLERGDMVEGVVKNITDFGVFIDLGPVDALVRTRDLSWKVVEHPSEIVSLGQKAKLKVLNVDIEKERLLCGLKQTITTRWHKLARTVRPGQVFKGTVKKRANRGTYIWLKPGLDGFLPKEEYSKYIRKITDLSEGDSINVKIKEIDEMSMTIVLVHPTAS